MEFCFDRDECIAQYKESHPENWVFFDKLDRKVRELASTCSQISDEATVNGIICYSDEQKEQYDLNYALFIFALFVLQEIVYHRSSTMMEELQLYREGKKEECFELMATSKTAYFWSDIDFEEIKEKFREIKLNLENLGSDNLKENLELLSEKKSKSEPNEPTFEVSHLDILNNYESFVFSACRKKFFEDKSEKYIYDSIISYCNFIIEL